MGRILDEFTAVTGLHRKGAIRLLAGSEVEKIWIFLEPAGGIEAAALPN